MDANINAMQEAHQKEEAALLARIQDMEARHEAELTEFQARHDRELCEERRNQVEQNQQHEIDLLRQELSEAKHRKCISDEISDRLLHRLKPTPNPFSRGIMHLGSEEERRDRLVQDALHAASRTRMRTSLAPSSSSTDGGRVPRHWAAGPLRPRGIH